MVVKSDCAFILRPAFGFNIIDEYDFITADSSAELQKGILKKTLGFWVLLFSPEVILVFAVQLMIFPCLLVKGKRSSLSTSKYKNKE